MLSLGIRSDLEERRNSSHLQLACRCCKILSGHCWGCWCSVSGRSSVGLEYSERESLRCRRRLSWQWVPFWFRREKALEVCCRSIVKVMWMSLPHMYSPPLHRKWRSNHLQIHYYRHHTPIQIEYHHHIFKYRLKERRSCSL